MGSLEKEFVDAVEKVETGLEEIKRDKSKLNETTKNAEKEGGWNVAVSWRTRRRERKEREKRRVVGGLGCCDRKEVEEVELAALDIDTEDAEVGAVANLQWEAIPRDHHRQRGCILGHPAELAAPVSKGERHCGN